MINSTTKPAVYELVHQYSFLATHEIHGLPVTHPCSGVHSHRWTIEVVFVVSTLRPTDGPPELADLEPLRRYILSDFSDSHVNDVIIGPATPARVAHHVASWCLANLKTYLSTTLSSVLVTADVHSRARYTVVRHAGIGKPGPRA